jgi:hypothetical protein
MKSLNYSANGEEDEDNKSVIEIQMEQADQ